MEENESPAAVEQEEKYDYSIEYEIDEKYAFEETMMSYRNLLIYWFLIAVISSSFLINALVKGRLYFYTAVCLIGLTVIYGLLSVYNYYRRKKYYSMQHFFAGGKPTRVIDSLGDKVSTHTTTDTSCRSYDYSGIIWLYKTENIYFLKFKQKMMFMIPKKIAPEGGEREFEEYVIRKAKNVRIKKFIPFKLHRYLCYLFMLISVACAATYATLLIIFS